MTATIESYRPGQTVRVRWERDRWLIATVYRTYEKGLDAVVGSRGLHYFQVEDVREA